MTEVEALKRFIPILGRISPPGERVIITRNILERIAGRCTNPMGVNHKHAGALAWPNDTTKAGEFESAMDNAVDAGEFVSFIHRRDRRHFQIEELASWPGCPAIAPDSPLVFWLGEPVPAQTTTPAPAGGDEIDFTMVATRGELINAFGVMTKMDLTWFDNLTDTPRLMAARKFKGQGRRNGAEPLFCPFEVLQWLIDPKRKKGGPITDTTAWRRFKSHFPKVYNRYSIGDPNGD